jgi:hypothetical protein
MIRLYRDITGIWLSRVIIVITGILVVAILLIIYRVDIYRCMYFNSNSGG